MTAAPRARRSPSRRSVLAAPLVALVTVPTALVATEAAGVPLRDPDHVAALYLALVCFGVALLIGLDIVVRAAHRSGTRAPSRDAMRQVQAERWTLAQGAVVGSALVSFYVTYMAYRNLKSVVPLLRPGQLFDRQLGDFDRSLFAGRDPAELAHTLLGTGITAHFLSAVYVAFIVFLPLSLAVALVFSADLRAGLFYATAQSVNWLIGAGSYFLLPSLGPVYSTPGAFAALPASEVTHLQAVLLDQRIEFLRDPTTATPQAIAAFASLHISMNFTAAMIGHLVGAGRRLQIGLWVWFALSTASTVYLGWHYVADDLGGLVLGVTALVIARALTGYVRRPAPRRLRIPGSRGAEVLDAPAGSGQI